MHPEMYALTWNDFSDHLIDMMKELMKNDNFSDVTLVTEDKKHMKAHKNVLSACSPVFKDLISFDKISNSIIYLRGIHFSELESIIQFIYCGEATINEERMNEFLMVAKSLEIKVLSKADAETVEPKGTPCSYFTDDIKIEPERKLPIVSEEPNTENRLNDNQKMSENIFQSFRRIPNS